MFYLLICVALKNISKFTFFLPPIINNNYSHFYFRYINILLIQKLYRSTELIDDK